MKSNKRKTNKRPRYRVESDEELETPTKKDEENNPPSPQNAESPDRSPCTQIDLIQWNWQSPETSSVKNNNLRSKLRITSTPKTSHVEREKYSKAKLTESPLMYPTKLEVFMKEDLEGMQRLLNSLNQNKDWNPSSPKQDEKCNKTDEKCNKTDETKVEEEDSLSAQGAHTPVRKVTPKQRSFEELFNDSMDESLYRCSQEVENQYLKEVRNAKDDETKSSNKSNTEANHRVSLDKRRSSSPKIKSDTVTFSKKTQNSGSNNLLERTVSTLSIPDDSFDDVFATCDFAELKIPSRVMYSKVDSKRETNVATSNVNQSYGLKQQTTTNKFIRHHSSPVSNSRVNNFGKRTSFELSTKTQNLSNTWSNYFPVRKHTVSETATSSSGVRKEIKSKEAKIVRTSEQIERNRREALRIREERQRQRKLLLRQNSGEK